MVRGLALGLASVMAVLGSAPRAEGDIARLPGGGRVAGDARRGVSYTLSRMADGGVRFSGDAPNLGFDKTSYKDGRFGLHIVSSGDSVTVNVDAFAIQVSHGGRTETIGTNAVTPEDLEKVRAALAGSAAVKRYRQFAAALEASGEHSPASYGVLNGAALIDALVGDLEASARIGRHLARAGAKSPSGAPRLREVTTADCWSSYEQTVNQAAGDLQACYVSAQSAAWWLQGSYFEACSLAWVIRAEGCWLEYISCSGYALLSS